MVCPLPAAADGLQNPEELKNPSAEDEFDPAHPYTLLVMLKWYHNPEDFAQYLIDQYPLSVVRERMKEREREVLVLNDTVVGWCNLLEEYAIIMLLTSVQHAGLLGGICTILFLACACSEKVCEYYAIGSSYGIAWLVL